MSSQTPQAYDTKILYDAIQSRTIATVGFYVGGMKEKDLKISEGKKVIIGTYAMAEEGLDINIVNELIKRGHKVNILSGSDRMAMGGGQIICRDPETGIIFAGSEPRKDGAAVGW